MEKALDESRRARDRQAWAVTKHHLTEARSDNLSASTTARERLEMMWQLAVDAWASAGKVMPTYDRKHMPGRILKGYHGTSASLE